MKEIQDWMGHKDYSTTANIYAHVLQKAKMKLAKTMSNIVKGIHMT